MAVLHGNQKLICNKNVMRKKAILFSKFASGFLHDDGIKMNDFESGRLIQDAGNMSSSQ